MSGSVPCLNRKFALRFPSFEMKATAENIIDYKYNVNAQQRYFREDYLHKL